MKRKKPKGARKWTKEQAERYSKDIRSCKPIDGTFLHTVKVRKQAMKYAKTEVNDETLHSDL